MLEKAWKIKETWAFLWMEMGWKKSFINISWNEKWLVFRIEFSWEMDDENPFINIIWIWKWLMKISENWNRIINISEDWNRLMNISGLWKWIINTSEIFFWIIWWKNHDIHENKNVCPEFNGEKMHEQNVSPQKQIIAKKVNSFIVWAFLHYNKKKRPCFIAMMNRGLFSMLFPLKSRGESHL